MLLVSIFVFEGCGVVHSLQHPFTVPSIESSGTQNPTQASISSGKPTPVSTPIKSFFANVTRLAIVIGGLSLLAGGALIYFGSVIPGVKCIVGGIALPVAAIWIDYHYGLVIWLLCIGSAVGFIWALNKYDPALAAKLLADYKAGLAAAENELSALKKSCNYA